MTPYGELMNPQNNEIYNLGILRIYVTLMQSLPPSTKYEDNIESFHVQAMMNHVSVCVSHDFICAPFWLQFALPPCFHGESILISFLIKLWEFILVPTQSSHHLFFLGELGNMPQVYISLQNWKSTFLFMILHDKPRDVSLNYWFFNLLNHNKSIFFYLIEILVKRHGK